MSNLFMWKVTGMKGLQIWTTFVREYTPERARKRALQDKDFWLILLVQKLH